MHFLGWWRRSKYGSKSKWGKTETLKPYLMASGQRWKCKLLSQSCPTLCDPMDYSPPGPSVHRIFQARILEWVAMPSRGSTRPRDQTSSLTSPALAGGFYTTSTTWEAPKSVSCSVMLVTLSGPILWDPMDYSPPGPSVHGILQARILEWVAMPSSRRASRLRDQTCIS